MGTTAAIRFGALDVAAGTLAPTDGHDLVRSLTGRALLAAPLAAVAVLLASALLAAVLTRDLPDASAPWTERARRTFPMRRAMSIYSMFLALLPAALAYFALQRALPAAERKLVAVVVLAPSLAAMELVRARVESRIHGRRIGLARWLAYKTTWLPILAPHLLVAFASAALLPHRDDATAWALALLVLAALLVSWTGLAWLPLRALGVIRPAPPRLEAAVARAADAVGVRPRAIHVVPTFGVPVANALALPILRHVAFTDEALGLLDDEELTAIAAHELGHVGEPRAIAWGRSALAFVLAPIAVAPVLHAALGVPGLLVAFLAVLLGTRLHRRWAQRLEVRADAVAREDEDPEASRVYARALERLYERNLAPAVMPGKAGTHPHLYDRLLAAGVTPSYPRPEPPRRSREVAVGALVLVAFAAACVVASIAGQDAFERAAGRAYAVEAERHVDRGDLSGALALYVDATRLSHHDAKTFAREAELLATSGECRRAGERLAIARRGEDREAAGESIDAARRALLACTFAQATSRGPIVLDAKER